MDKYEIETKKDSQGNDIFHVRPSRGTRMAPSGWWKTEDEAIEAHEHLLK